MKITTGYFLSQRLTRILLPKTATPHFHKKMKNNYSKRVFLLAFKPREQFLLIAFLCTGNSKFKMTRIEADIFFSSNSCIRQEVRMLKVELLFNLFRKSKCDTSKLM